VTGSADCPVCHPAWRSGTRGWTGGAGADAAALSGL